MKTNFTSQLLKGIITSAFFLYSFAAFSNNISGTSANSGNLTVTIVNGSVVMNWSNTTAEYYEIQASKDGKNFTTIGMVMGADPKGDGNSYSFKQQLAKLKPGKPYYRVVIITADNKAIATEAVKAN
ncbi:MAG: hypothetical protein WBP45_10790 [Daejeonella sp.]